MPRDEGDIVAIFECRAPGPAGPYNHDEWCYMGPFGLELMSQLDDADILARRCAAWTDGKRFYAEDGTETTVVDVELWHPDGSERHTRRVTTTVSSEVVS